MLIPRRFFFIIAIVFIFLYFSIYDYVQFRFSPTKVYQNQQLDEHQYLIKTETCLLQQLPLLDNEIVPYFKNNSGKNFQCNKNTPPFSIDRFNLTWLSIQYPLNEVWECHAFNIVLIENDSYQLDATIGPLPSLTNFANNLSETEMQDPSSIRWDSIMVKCNNFNRTYQRVVPLVQHYFNKRQNETKNKSHRMNVILLGLDSISRLNFERQMPITKQWFEEKQFIPMYGYHKVGENSFPNILPMLTGRLMKDYNEFLIQSSEMNLDQIPFIFKLFKDAGYMTTFIEDMPLYGFFVQRGTFSEQPTHYYLRATNLAIWDDLYNTYSCYQNKLEHEIYWDYIIDQLKLFRQHEQTFFTFAHMSTLTHDYFNNAGYADKPFHSFMQRIFDGNHHKDSVIIVYSDHGLRFGRVINTTASIYEQRLPFIYLYIPDSLSLSGIDADQLRQIVRHNQHRLTSHIDLHATMLHVLTHSEPQLEPYGKSLLTPIPLSRTCDTAGIPSEYCLCDMYEPINVTSTIISNAEYIVFDINQKLASHGNFCMPLVLDETYRALEAIKRRSNTLLRLIHFRAKPSNAIFEGIIEIADSSSLPLVKSISRLDRYGSQSQCVSELLDIVAFCYCWQ